MIDRTIIPQISKIKHVDYQKPVEYIADNGNKVFGFYSKNAPIIKLDIIFNAGVLFQSTALQSVFANSLIKEAPKGKNSDEISEFFDYHGSYIESFISPETAGLRLFVPSKYYKDVIDTFLDFINNPDLPKDEFEILQKKYFQAIKNNLKKTQYVAQKGLDHEIFGPKHPLGYILKPDDANNIEYSKIKEFVRDYYQSNNCDIIISGDYSLEMIEVLRDNFKNQKNEGNRTSFSKNINLSKLSGEMQKLRVYEFKDAVQSGLCAGLDLGKPNTEESLILNVLNMVFGGYFGSKLMKNIREDKGYTYGIGSGIRETENRVLLKIVSEVGVDVTQKAIDEIYYEMDMLTKKTISEDELEAVKSYMIGEILSSVDGVIPCSMVFEKLYSQHRDLSYITEQINTINNVTPEVLMHTAQKFFNSDKLSVVVAGKV
ncbi:MAG: pitrilysin family protein [Bacteroidales bacterium]|nr:pitrilysin family protein [Bacteroidales bacterium]